MKLTSLLAIFLPVGILALIALIGLAWRSAGAFPDRASGPQDASGSSRASETNGRSPGWIAVYETVDGGAASRRVTRIDSQPSSTWGTSPPHPRLGSGPFRASWRGRFSMDGEENRIVWSAFLAGSLTLRVDGRVVLEATGHGVGHRVSGKDSGPLSPGEHEITLLYESASEGPSRLQLWWEGDTFRREPFPAWRVSHRLEERPAELAVDRTIDDGHRIAIDHGCLRCHRSGNREVDVPPPGPRLPGPRLQRPGSGYPRRWLLEWLANPRALHPQARMPRLFAADRQGFVERWLVAGFLGDEKPLARPAAGRWRQGKKEFIMLGCVACHLLPDSETPRDDPERRSLRHVAGRSPLEEIVSIILEPFEKYPGGEMPRFAISRKTAREIAGYLVRWGEPGVTGGKDPETPASGEVIATMKRLGMNTAGLSDRQGGIPAPLIREAGKRLAIEKRCAACHEGLVDASAARRPPELRHTELRHAAGGCLEGETLPRFSLRQEDRRALELFLAAQVKGWVDSTFHRGRLSLRRLGCFRCHAGRGEETSPLEQIVQRVDFEMFPARLPYLRVPPLPGAGIRFQRGYLLGSIEKGISGVRPSWYTYRMPGYGSRAEEIVRVVLAEDGELTDTRSPGAGEAGRHGRPVPTREVARAEQGRQLVGHAGYSCVSCHTWKGQSDFHTEPGSVGPDLTVISQRVRREWFDRWLESPQRFSPRTPMPAFFPRALEVSPLDVLGGNPELQKDAIWHYLLEDVASKPPRLRAPLALDPPQRGQRPRVGQIPLRLPGGGKIEALVIQFPGDDHDIVVYDVEKLSVHSWWEGAELLRDDPGWRTWLIEGRRLPVTFHTPGSLGLDLASPLEERSNASIFDSPHRFLGFDILPHGVRIRSSLATGKARLRFRDELRMEGSGDRRGLSRRIEWHEESSPRDPARKVELRYPR